MIIIMMEASLSKKKNQDKPKEERWLLSTLFKHKAKEKEYEGERERKNSISHHHFSLQCIRSLIFFSFLVKDCSSVSKLLLLSFSLFLYLSLSLSYNLF
jgi:hypothetical protein